MHAIFCLHICGIFCVLDAVIQRSVEYMGITQVHSKVLVQRSNHLAASPVLIPH